MSLSVLVRIALFHSRFHYSSEFIAVEVGRL